MFYHSKRCLVGVTSHAFFTVGALKSSFDSPLNLNYFTLCLSTLVYLQKAPGEISIVSEDVYAAGEE